MEFLKCFVDERFINKAQFDAGFAHGLILKDGAVPAIKDPGHDSELQMVSETASNDCFVGNRRKCSSLFSSAHTARPSRILAMNFGSFTTRGHSPITWTFTPHSYRSLIDCISHHPLHQHSCSTDHACTCLPSHNHHHPITHTHTPHTPHTYISSALSPTHLPGIVSPLTLQSVSSLPC